jgi:hypothetical protein
MFYTERFQNLKYFKVNCPYRSGSEFFERLLSRNFEGLHVPSPTIVPGWKHFLPPWKDIHHNVLIARHPLKWMNSIIHDDKQMHRIYNVSVKEKSELTYGVAGQTISVEKLLDRWHEFYYEWFKWPDVEFVWYHDVLTDRQKVIDYFEQVWNLERKLEYKETGELFIPSNVPHSDSWSNQRELDELNLDKLHYMRPKFIEYVKQNVDVNLIDKMNELRKNYNVHSDIEI